MHVCYANVVLSLHSGPQPDEKPALPRETALLKRLYMYEYVYMCINAYMLTSSCHYDQGPNQMTSLLQCHTTWLYMHMYTDAYLCMYAMLMLFCHYIQGPNQMRSPRCRERLPYASLSLAHPIHVLRRKHTVSADNVYACNVYACNVYACVYKHVTQYTC